MWLLENIVKDMNKSVSEKGGIIKLNKLLSYCNTDALIDIITFYNIEMVSDTVSSRSELIYYIYKFLVDAYNSDEKVQFNYKNPINWILYTLF